MHDELARIGYLGSMPCSHNSNPLAAHFELHIEQGPVLERSKHKIGVVEGVQSYVWRVITVEGREAHTGTTDMLSRSDAVHSATSMISKIRKTAWDLGGLATVGVIETKPGATNTIAGEVTFTLDIRGKTDEIVKKIDSTCWGRFLSMKSRFIDNQNGSVTRDAVQISSELVSRSPAVRFHDECIGCVEQATREMLGEDAVAGLSQRMTSGAGHDSVYTSKVCPTSMVFVPCKDGVSHNPAEYCAPEDCKNGAEVLGNAVLLYDERRKERES